MEDKSFDILSLCYRVHSELGSGLLESIYSKALEIEFIENNFKYQRESLIPVYYKGNRLDLGFRADFVINKNIILELKSVQEINPIHKAQLFTYLKLSGIKTGLLINFNTVHLKDGITRIVM